MVFTKIKKNARRFVCCVLLISICVGLSVCEIISFFSACKVLLVESLFLWEQDRLVKSKPYDVEWMIGKTSAEIAERYGQFHTTNAELGEDGKYRDGGCTYTVREFYKSTDGTPWPAVYVGIHFDESGLCTKADYYMDYSNCD